MDENEMVRARAFAIWEAAGRPAGRALEHWLEAEHAIDLGGSSGDAAPAADAPDLAPDLAPGAPGRPEDGPLTSVETDEGPGERGPDARLDDAAGAPRAPDLSGIAIDAEAETSR